MFHQLQLHTLAMVLMEQVTGEAFGDWPDIRLPPGTVARLIDEDRDET
jgi:hypothetical protein